jgi:hypothetical protein
MSMYLYNYQYIISSTKVQKSPLFFIPQQAFPRVSRTFPAPFPQVSRRLEVQQKSRENPPKIPVAALGFHPYSLLPTFHHPSLFKQRITTLTNYRITTSTSHPSLFKQIITKSSNHQIIISTCSGSYT